MVYSEYTVICICGNKTITNCDCINNTKNKETSQKEFDKSKLHMDQDKIIS